MMLKRVLGSLLTAVGVLAFVMGCVFALQGWGVIGPASSAMAGNPEWIRNGMAVAIIGAAVAFLGLKIRAARR